MGVMIYFMAFEKQSMQANISPGLSLDNLLLFILSTPVQASRHKKEIKSSIIHLDFQQFSSFA